MAYAVAEMALRVPGQTKKSAQIKNFRDLASRATKIENDLASKIHSLGSFFVCFTGGGERKMNGFLLARPDVTPD